MTGQADTVGAPTAVGPDHACAACGYPMGPSGSRTCPECGRVATEEDLREATRRRVYLEVTVLSTSVAYAALPFVGFGLIGVAPFAYVYGLLAFVHVGLMSAAMGRWGDRVIASRVTRLAAVRSGWVLHAPLIAGVAALELMEQYRWQFVLGGPRQGRFALPDVLGIGAPLLVLLGIVLHRAAARRAHRIAGVTRWAQDRATPLVRRGWLYPPLLASALIAAGYVLHVLTR